MTRQEEIQQGLAQVHERIARACAEADRPDPVDLVVVTKTFPASDVAVLAGLGVTDVAENRDQEARAKRAELEGGSGESGLEPERSSRLRWHMIGQLQRNKAASVARWADVVESVDRPELAVALGRGAAAAGRSLEVLVQVSLDPVPGDGRGGIAPDAAVDLAGVVVAQPGLVLRGVMGVAPHPGDPAAAFARLRVVADRIRDRWPTSPVDGGRAGAVAERWRYDDGAGEFGFISSVTAPFCGDCSRARLSSEGAFYTCLFATAGLDLRAPLRAGADDDALLELLRRAWNGRADRYSEIRESERAAGRTLHKVEMHYIGG